VVPAPRSREQFSAGVAPRLAAAGVLVEAVGDDLAAERHASRCWAVAIEPIVQADRVVRARCAGDAYAAGRIYLRSERTAFSPTSYGVPFVHWTVMALVASTAVSMTSEEPKSGSVAELI
jgi:hypothetical protein